MRYLLLIGLLIAPTVHAGETDKVAHAAVSFGAQVTCSGIVKRLSGSKAISTIGCAFLVLSAGVLKESQDQYQDSADLRANLLGTSLGALTYTIVF